MPTGVSRQISLVIDGYSAHFQDVTSMILGNVKRPLPLAFKMKHSCLQQLTAALRSSCNLMVEISAKFLLLMVEDALIFRFHKFDLRNEAIDVSKNTC